MADGTENETPPAAAPTRRDAFAGLDYAEVVGVASGMRGEARVASSRQETWAAEALASLTASCDGAREDDGVGFNKSDTNAGRYLGHFIARGGMLDDVEWQGAIDMLQKYHGQIGRAPRPDAQDEARAARVDAAERAAAGDAEGSAFKARLAAVLTEAKRVQKARIKHLKRLADPEVIITRENADDASGGVWVVSAPYCEAAVQAWRNLHREFGGGWSKSRGVRIVPFKGARALHTLLTTHHAGQAARGLKGAYVIGGTTPPLKIDEITAALNAAVAPEAAPAPAAPAPAAVQVAPVTTRVVATVSDALEVLADATATEAEIAAALALLR
jgi:hypothetical protein